MSETANDDPAWAVWIHDGRDKETVALMAPDEAAAREQALDDSDIDDPDDVHIDGPFYDAEPAYFEFEFITEHRETVVVEAPYEDYARETAQQERTYDGELTQTLHTHVHRIPKGDSDE